MGVKVRPLLLLFLSFVLLIHGLKFVVTTRRNEEAVNRPPRFVSLSFLRKISARCAIFFSFFFVTSAKAYSNSIEEGIPSSSPHWPPQPQPHHHHHHLAQTTNVENERVCSWCTTTAYHPPPTSKTSATACFRRWWLFCPTTTNHQPWKRASAHFRGWWLFCTPTTHHQLRKRANALDFEVGGCSPPPPPNSPTSKTSWRARFRGGLWFSTTNTHHHPQKASAYARCWECRPLLISMREDISNFL